MEIVASRISVYEVELDLNSWDVKTSNKVPGFSQKILELMPTLSDHKCMEGKPGGFIREVEKGTNFAHIIEHVLLEMIHLADKGQVYKGWTRKLEKDHYVIHYNAPDFLKGRLAAILAVDFVKHILQNKNVKSIEYLDILKNPIDYFSGHKTETTELYFADSINEFKTVEKAVDELKSERLTTEQQQNIILIISHIQKHFGFIRETWRKSFLTFGGEFAKTIENKIELINIDKFAHYIIQNEFDRVFSGIKNLSHLINTYQIPKTFVIRSIWLFKNKLLRYIIEEYQNDKLFLQHAIKDLEDFYQIILKNVKMGFEMNDYENNIFSQLPELVEFRELEQIRGYVLIVDDDEVARQACADILRYHSYPVLTVSTGFDALDKIVKMGDEITLVILDINLPDMNGKEVYQQIKNSYPDKKIIISSGFLPDDQRIHFKHDVLTAFIDKPYKAVDIVNKVKMFMEDESK